MTTTTHQRHWPGRRNQRREETFIITHRYYVVKTYSHEPSLNSNSKYLLKRTVQQKIQHIDRNRFHSRWYFNNDLWQPIPKYCASWKKKFHQWLYDGETKNVYMESVHVIEAFWHMDCLFCVCSSVCPFVVCLNGIRVFSSFLKMWSKRWDLRNKYRNFSNILNLHLLSFFFI